ncbi:methionine aminopeptidase, type I [Trichinella nativa]|uniref:Methionine aminopeptidase n=1 Tax=Trichinella nativa TaxID=6335 RepID=A0A1Y3EHY2_9BILA|nr:methionine aminopeptidase, type I [Trichinella nativa]
MSTESQICQRPECNNVAKLKCPTCIKLNLKPSYFCCQVCFDSLIDNRLIECLFLVDEVHFSGLLQRRLVKSQADSQIGDNASKISVNQTSKTLYPEYSYTGKLRAYAQGVPRFVPLSITRPDYVNVLGGISYEERDAKNRGIRILCDEEIESLRLACRLGREVLNEAAAAIDVGVTTDEIDRIVHEACIERECYPSPLGYLGFPRSCCTSVNEVICHGIPDLRPLEDGDIVNGGSFIVIVDVTVYHRGFHGDLNETFFVGNVDDDSKKLVRVTYESLVEAIKIVHPGRKYREIGDVIEKYVRHYGFSVVRSYSGHGIHRLFHTAPTVPHYSKNKAVGVMKPGHSFTIEPMINRGSYRDTSWPDRWTAVTVDGKRSAQFEHTILVTDAGCEVLTARQENNGQPWFMDNL